MGGTSSIEGAAGAGQPPATGRWVLALTSVASFMVALDSLVVTTALTAIRLALHASVAELQWTVNAYILTFAVLLMTAAAVGDRFGRRRTFVAGIGLFTLASAACAVAPGADWLIAARAVQGAGAAMIMPLAMTLLTAAVPAERRGWALGVFGGVTGLAVGGGPVVGGAIAQGLAWQWIFWLNVPIGLAAAALTLRHIRASSGPGAAIDLGGAALVTVSGLALVWGLVRAASAGWGSPQVAGSFAVAAVAAAALVAWERRARAPMLPLRLFRARAFAAGNAVSFLLQAALTGAVFFMAQFQQVALGQGALGAGLRLLPWTGALVLVAPRAGRLADRLGDRPLVVTGLFLQAAGLAWIALVARPALPYPELIAPMIIAGTGVSLAMPGAQKAVVTAVAPAEIGTASGTFQTARQLGGAVGVAVCVAAFAAAGGYGSARAFSAGFAAALAVSAGLSAAGVIAGLALPRRSRPAATGRPAATAATAAAAAAAATADVAAAAGSSGQ
jgi:EmrB/QacA subfamily drug resistance transporter